MALHDGIIMFVSDKIREITDNLVELWSNLHAC